MNSERLERAVRALLDVSPKLDADGRRVALAIYELLASGAAPTAGDIARRAGVDERIVESALGSWPGVFTADGRVVGFWGLALGEMPHVFEVGGVETRTWCAWDPLFIAPLIGATARVSSTCPVSGRTVTLQVGADGVSDLDPPTAVMSFLAPAERFTDDVITTFCHYVLFFADTEAGERFIGDHPDTFLVTVHDGFDAGRRWRERFARGTAD